MAAVITNLITSVTSSAFLVRANFTGIDTDNGNSPQTVAITGLIEGDIPIWIYAPGHFEYNIDGNGYFEPIVTANDQIQQTYGGAWSFQMILLRGI